MRISQSLIDEGCASGKCDACNGPTLPNGELCASCAILIGGSLIADSLATTEPSDIVRALNNLSARVWTCSWLRITNEQMEAENTQHGR